MPPSGPDGPRAPRIQLHPAGGFSSGLEHFPPSGPPATRQHAPPPLTASQPQKPHTRGQPIASPPSLPADWAVVVEAPTPHSPRRRTRRSSYRQATNRHGDEGSRLGINRGQPRHTTGTAAGRRGFRAIIIIAGPKPVDVVRTKTDPQVSWLPPPGAVSFLMPVIITNINQPDHSGPSGSHGD